jgi:uncharacterized protein YndB with AHSA1/START domain
MKLQRKVHIEAPPERVWHVMTDIERWPEWTPSTLAVKRLDDGPLRIGSSAELELRGAPKAVWVVSELEEGRWFRWDSRAMPSVSAGHLVEPAGNSADVTLSIEPRGVLGTLLAPLIVRMSRKNVEAEAEGLKRRCEEA